MTPWADGLRLQTHSRNAALGSVWRRTRDGICAAGSPRRNPARAHAQEIRAARHRPPRPASGPVSSAVSRIIVYGATVIWRPDDFYRAEQPACFAAEKQIPGFARNATRTYVRN
jgi:hypothetical protein